MTREERNEYNRKYRAEHRDEINAAVRAKYNPEKQAIRSKAWRDANRDKVAEYAARSDAKTSPELRKAERAAYYQANKDKMNADMKAYREANPEATVERIRNWKANNEGHTYTDPSGYINYVGYEHPATNACGLTREHRIVLWDKLDGQDAMCHWGCGTQLYWSKSYPKDLDGLVVDHVNAVRDDNRPENLVPSCSSCNSSRMKGTRVVPPCSIDACDRPTACKGLCKVHYQQKWQGRDVDSMTAVGERYVKVDAGMEEEIIWGIEHGDTIEEIAELIGTHSSTVARNFKRITGKSVRQYRASAREAA